MIIVVLGGGENILPYKDIRGSVDPTGGVQWFCGSRFWPKNWCGLRFWGEIFCGFAVLEILTVCGFWHFFRAVFGIDPSILTVFGFRK